MTHFFTKSQTVEVSQITASGWWIKNTQEHVAKGTALGADFTQTIYTPSSEGMIARYDRDTDTWSDEIEDMTWKEYWDVNGQSFYVGEPDGAYPEKAILTPPPAYNQETHTIFYTESKGWTVYEIKIGTPFYDEFGNEYLVSDYNFTLPEKCTWEAPPKVVEVDGLTYAPKLVNGEWAMLVDLRNQTAYVKDRNSDAVSNYEIEELGDIPDTHTLIAPSAHDSWVDGVGWQYDQARHEPVKRMEESAWRDTQLLEVLNRLDQYEKDQSYPVEFRTSPFTEAQYMQLIQDRKLLSDYPETQNFPFATRPELSGLIAA